MANINIKKLNCPSFLKSQKADTIYLFILAFISTFQVGYLLSTACIFGACWGLVLTGFYGANVALLLYVRKFIKSHADGMFKRRTIWACVLGVIIAVLYVFGYQLQYIGYSAPGFLGKASILLRAIALLPLFYPLLYMLLYGVDHVKGVDVTGKAYYSKKKIFLFAWLVIFVAWIPAFLAYYPMILSYDFHAQVLRAELGFAAFDSHHPYLSTMEISLFYHIGKVMGNTQLGMAFMGVFHMLVNSAVYGYAVLLISKLLPKKATPYVACAVFALFPTIPVMVLSTTKDVIFSAFFMLFIITIFERVLFSQTKTKKIIFDILIILTGIFSCLWRNNTVYAVVVAGILLVIFVKKKAKLLILAAAILIFMGNKGGQTALKAIVHDTREPNAIEMLSVVVQAYGRITVRNMDSLDPEVERIMEYYVPISALRHYNTGISDSLKSAIIGNDTYGHFKDDWGATFKDFLYVISRYPNEFLDSFLDTTRGFWFIDDTSFADVLGEGYEGRMGIIYTYNSSESELVEEIKHETKFPLAEKFYEAVISEDVILRMPIINYLFKIAGYTIGTFLMAALYLYKKNYKGLGLITFSVMYILTMFLGPVVQYRYAYPWIITFPLFVLLFFINDKKMIEDNAESAAQKEV
ncbi:MAG: DUF6020 family protein [Lachnospiraceae bacterium]|nr:DUF6020 family protein [Lachnospiraceae bacterium]